MNPQELQRQMYERRDASMPQRIMSAGIGAVWTALAWWLFAGSGLPILGHWLGRTWPPADPLRRFFLAAGISVCYVRILFTEFVFLKRGVGWFDDYASRTRKLIPYLH